MDRVLKCSFCGKGQAAVEYLIAHPPIYICSECVDLCAEVISEKRANKAKQPADGEGRDK